MTPFFVTDFSHPYDFTDSKIIIGGDFNIVLNQTIDGLTTRSRRLQSTETIKQYMEEFGLGDSWCINNTTVN